MFLDDEFFDFDDDEEETSARSDKKSEAKMAESKSKVSTIFHNSLQRSEYTSNPSKFINTPCPEGVTVQGYIIRNKRKLLQSTFYKAYLKGDDLFIMTSTKKKWNKTSNFLISTEEKKAMDKNPQAYVGKLSANFRKTEYVLNSVGYNPMGPENIYIRDKLAQVSITSNLLDSEGPRKITCVVPKGGENGAPKAAESEVKKLPKPSDSIELENVHQFVNCSPKWDNTVHAYILDFGGRVTQPSVKNFILGYKDNEEKIVLTFGKVGDDDFTMDFTYPLTPLQAFGICLSSFDA